MSTRIHKCVPTDKICSCCSMTKPVYERVTKMVKVVFHTFGGHRHVGVMFQ